MSQKALNLKNTNKFGINSNVEKHGFLNAVARTVMTWQERASMRHHLADLSEENLSDIGLSFEQAQAESRKPFWQH